MTPDQLRRRLAEFAREISEFGRPLLHSVETVDVARQLRRAASSAASQHRAAGRARSHAEFTAKIGAALEEADEALFWLEHLRDCGLADEKQLAPLLKEGAQVVAILTASTQTARGRHRRPPPRRNQRKPPHDRL